MIEVELRAFITSQQYDCLLQYLLKEGEEVEHTRQITYYLDHGVDTRVQIFGDGGRVWQKLGKMHQSARKEYEIIMSRSDARKMLEIFHNLDFNVRVCWFRERRKFNVGKIAVALDNTIGYGRILEAEISCEEGEVELNRQVLLDFLNKLDITPTNKQTMDMAFSDYLRTWREKTVGLHESWVDELLTG